MIISFLFPQLLKIDVFVLKNMDSTHKNTGNSTCWIKKNLDIVKNVKISKTLDIVFFYLHLIENVEWRL